MNKAFWKGLAERAIKTAAQVFVATIGVGVGGNSLGVTDVDWGTVLSVTALATILSVATSIGNASFTAGKPEPHGIDPAYGPMTEDQVLIPVDDDEDDSVEDLIPTELPPTELDHEVLDSDDPEDVPARYAAEEQS